AAPGPVTGLPSIRIRPDVCGNCGVSPAIIRITVDLPQPDGPRIDTNSPRPGASSLENDTSLIAVHSPNDLVTLSNSTTGALPAAGGASGFIRGAAWSASNSAS